MKLLKLVLTHLSFIFSVVMIVPLFIDMFTSGAAMGFLLSPLYKWLLLFSLIFSTASAAITIYYRKKRK